MTSDPETNRKLLDEVVGNIAVENNIPGVAVGILHEGLTFTTCYGVTSVENPLSVNDDTTFQLASITKTYTATAVMKLVETGKLDLDATVQTYIPDFRVADETASSGATIRHLLSHTAGWEGDVFNDTGSGDDALERYVSEMAELEQLSPLGTVYSYCNSGYSVLGRIIEVVTGESFRTAMKELVLRPLGLEHTYFEMGDILTRRFAVGHNPTDNGCVVVRPLFLARSANPAGGIFCDIQDLLRYARFHLGDGRIDSEARLLTSESMGLMQSPQLTIWDIRSIGMPWDIYDINGVRVLFHGGATNGQISLLTLVPELDFASAILTNAEHGGIVIREVSRWVLKHFLEIERPEPEPLESSEEELAPYAGLYRRPHVDIDIAMKGGYLTARQTSRWPDFPSVDPPPASLTLCEKDRLISSAGGPAYDVIRKPDGSIEWLRIGDRIHKRME